MKRFGLLIVVSAIFAASFILNVDKGYKRTFDDMFPVMSPALNSYSEYRLPNN